MRSLTESQSIDCSGADESFLHSRRRHRFKRDRCPSRVWEGSARVLPCWPRWLGTLSCHTWEMILYGVCQWNGTVSRHPKRIQIYRYNLESDPELQRRLLARLSPWRRMVWKTRVAFLGPKQARIRIPAEDMFGRSRVVDEARLRAVIWANPSSGDAVTVRSIQPAEAARRCGVALMDELWDICRFMSLGSVLSPAGMAIGEFFDRVVDVYESAFTTVPVVEMLVPERSNPEVLAREIARIASTNPSAVST